MCEKCKLSVYGIYIERKGTKVVSCDSVDVRKERRKMEFWDSKVWIAKT